MPWSEISSKTEQWTRKVKSYTIKRLYLFKNWFSKFVLTAGKNLSHIKTNMVNWTHNYKKNQISVKIHATSYKCHNFIFYLSTQQATFKQITICLTLCLSNWSSNSVTVLPTLWVSFRFISLLYIKLSNWSRSWLNLFQSPERNKNTTVLTQLVVSPFESMFVLINNQLGSSEHLLSQNMSRKKLWDDQRNI